MSIEKHQRIAYALLLVCAAARLMLQMAAMPPYAGLDEVYHVARLAFVRAEHRNPTTTEPSIPPYLMRSIAGGEMPAMGEIGARWPDFVRGIPRSARNDTELDPSGIPRFARNDTRLDPSVIPSAARNPLPIVVDRALTSADMKPYVARNYEAQQTSLYYSLAAPLVPVKSALFDLRAWRAMSLLFALVTVLATAEIGRRWAGAAGILGAALLVSLPTWQTLVMRAGNDAFACMLAAVALAISVAAPRRVLSVAAEAIVWALAINAKMYTWPLAVVLPVLWLRQRPLIRRARVVVVSLAIALAAVATFAELSHRTRNPLGVVAFDRPGGAAYESRVDVGELVRVTIASGTWTSGQHNDALRPLAIAMYLGPIVIAVAAAAAARSRHGKGRQAAALQMSVAALAAFALAQTWNVIACVLARRGGNPIPIGGKEGWYWYVLAPLLIPALLAPALRWRPVAWWLIAWDVLITEVALLHDFAGGSAPAAGSFLFRWGPLHAPFTAHLGGIGAGPLAAWTTPLRLVHLAAFFGLESVLQRMRRNDRNADSSASR